MWTDDYVTSRILAADPLELVQLLYEGAVDAVRVARERLREGDIEQRSLAISKAQAILAELAASLDHSSAGELSGRLAELYDYMQRRLLEANARQTDEPLAETLALLSTLLEGWREIRSTPDCGVAPSGYTAVAASGEETATVSDGWML